MNLIIFITIYFLSVYTSKYALLSQYDWFNCLPYNSIKSFKLFNCKACTTFWIASILSVITNIFIPYEIAYALIVYLFVKVDEIWEYINDRP